MTDSMTVLWDHEIQVGDVLVAVVLMALTTKDDWYVRVEFHNPDGEMVKEALCFQGSGAHMRVCDLSAPKMTRAQRTEFLAAIKEAKRRGNALWPMYADPPEAKA